MFREVNTTNFTKINISDISILLTLKTVLKLSTATKKCRQQQLFKNQMIKKLNSMIDQVKFEDIQALLDFYKNEQLTASSQDLEILRVYFFGKLYDKFKPAPPTTPIDKTNSNLAKGDSINVKNRELTKRDCLIVKDKADDNDDNSVEPDSVDSIESLSNLISPTKRIRINDTETSEK